MPPEIVYRRAEVQDVAALARIRAVEWGSEEYWRQRITGYVATTHHPHHALEPRYTCLAQRGEEIVGFIAGHLSRRFDCEGELEWLNVVKEHRRQGIAAALLRELAAWFVAQNALRVCVDVSPENAAARGFYSRHGAIDLKPSWMVWDDIRQTLKHQDAKHH